jgi:gamma-glutamyltranspeptidase/glutathione hydrolase
MRTVFEPQGHMVQAGDRLFIPGMAHTLQELAHNGLAALRSGHLGRAFLRDQAQRGGLITESDLAGYTVQTKPPIRINYRQYVVLLPPPCSTGGVLTAFALKLLAHFDVRANGHNSAGHLRLLYEIMAATTRARPLWDELSAGRGATEAVPAFLGEGVINRFVQEVQQALGRRTPSPAATEPPGPSNTSHLSVIDANGMAVALTTTAGESAGYVVPGTGFIPNNILGEEDLNPNGFHQWPAGQRIPTMMTPTIVLKDGRIRLVTGSGGSNRIRSAILQTLVNALDFDMPLQEAVSAARVHVENGTLQCEWGYEARAVDELEAMGYPVNRWPVRSIYFGGAHSVACDDAGRPEAAGDDRRGGATALINSGS